MVMARAPTQVLRKAADEDWARTPTAPYGTNCCGHKERTNTAISGEPGRMKNRRIHPRSGNHKVARKDLNAGLLTNTSSVPGCPLQVAWVMAGMISHLCFFLWQLSSQAELLWMFLQLLGLVLLYGGGVLSMDPKLPSGQDSKGSSTVPHSSTIHLVGLCLPSNPAE